MNILSYLFQFPLRFAAVGIGFVALISWGRSVLFWSNADDLESNFAAVREACAVRRSLGNVVVLAASSRLPNDSLALPPLPRSLPSVMLSAIASDSTRRQFLALEAALATFTDALAGVLAAERSANATETKARDSLRAILTATGEEAERQAERFIQRLSADEQEFLASVKRGNILATVAISFAAFAYLWLTAQIVRKYDETIASEFAYKNRLESLLNSSNGIYVVRANTQGAYTFANRAFIETFVPPDIEGGIVGKTALSFTLPEDYEIALKAARECLASEPGENVKASFRKFDVHGRVRFTEWEFVAVRDAKGAVHEIQCAGIDRTARNQIEQDLAAAKELLDDTGAAAKIGGWEMDVRSGEMRWTKETYHIYEIPYDADLSVEQGVANYAPEHQPVIREAVAKLQSDGAPFDLELRFITAKGRARWVRSIGKCARNAEGKIERLHGAFQDITEQVEARAYLQERETLIAKLLDALPGLVFALDVERATMNALSPGFQKQMGYSDHDYARFQAQMQEYIHPDDAPQFHEKIVALGDLGDAEVAEITYRLRRGDGAWRWFSFRLTAFQRGAEDGRVRQCIGAALDVGDLVEAKDRLAHLNKTLELRVQERTTALEAANKEQNELMDIAAHDLKNPLTAILSSSDILSHNILVSSHRSVPLEIPLFQRHIRLIHNAGEQMLDIITNLLDVQRLDSGAMRLAILPVKLDFLRALVEEFQIRAAQKNIVLRYEGAPIERAPAALGDERAMRQIMDNLLSNAVKFSPPWKNVVVGVRTRNLDGEPRLQIFVRDEGPGLTARDKEKLFGKFARLSAQPTGGEHSTGLGLSIVKRLTELQNGAVFCESEPGRGANFIVEFPCVGAEATHNGNDAER